MSATAVLALLAASAPAAAKSPPISGELSEPGYEVFALAASGEATSALADPGFRLRPSARSVSLHLRAADGTYAGPVVVGKKRKGKRAIVGVKEGADLGEVDVKAAKGYARLAEKPAERSLDTKREARARKGVPIGAGVFGRVLSRDLTGRGADRDLDGVPAPLDVDDDGDLVLDNLDSSTAGREARGAQADGCGSVGSYCPSVGPALVGDLGITENANAGSTYAQINSALSRFGWVNIHLPDDSAELDCAGDPLAGPPRAGLVYCSSGGTGRAAAGGSGPPFPGAPGESFDLDGDGFGTLVPSGFQAFYLSHGAVARDPDLDPSISQIGTGDVLVVHVTTGGDPSQCPPAPGTTNPSCASFPATVNYVFATTPALVSYSDGAGHESSVAYPVPPPGPSGSAPGQGGNGFPVSDSPDDADTDVELRLTFWRPQRKPIEGEACLATTPPCAWVDIGSLTYGSGAGGGSGGGACPQSAYSNPDSLWTTSPHPLAPGFTDPLDDQPSSPGNRFSYELNLSQCLTALGLSFEQGKEVLLAFTAGFGSRDSAQQNVAFRRE